MKNEWINGMRISILLILIIVLSIFLNGSGCTKIDTPIRTDSDEPGSPEGESTEDLFIIPEKYEILDTEPTRIQAQGGAGDIFWKTEPAFENLFLPETGKLVLFSPPDVSEDTILTIIAYDENNESSKADIFIIDEGMPPEPGDILINEIAWAGTLKNWRDEYIELINKTGSTFYLDNWSIENTAGTGISFFFSGKIGPGALFLISNYDQDSENTAISAPVDYADSSLSIPNSIFGPFVLKNYEGMIFDTAGDGGPYYIYGENTSELKSSMSRYTYSTSIEWDAGSWYTESVSINLLDETCGTPGAVSSDESDSSGTSDSDAHAIITEYSIDAGDEIGEDWVELYITKNGSIRNFTVTDLDGDDFPVTGGEDIEVTEGQYILIIWEDSDDELYSHEGDRFYIPDYHPAGTKDELVLLCTGDFLDGLCYYSEDIQFDDKETIEGYGWTGSPVYGKHASRKMDGTGYYLYDLQAASWDTGAAPTPGYINN